MRRGKFSREFKLEAVRLMEIGPEDKEENSDKE